MRLVQAEKIFVSCDWFSLQCRLVSLLPLINELNRTVLGSKLRILRSGVFDLNANQRLVVIRQLLQNRWVLKRGRVLRNRFVLCQATQQATHDFSGAGFG